MDAISPACPRLPVRWAAILSLISLILLTDAYAAVGRTSGAFDVSASGQANYSIPIVTPPGINGMTPQLALVYGHGSSNTLIGVGWNIAGLTAIRRCPRTWAQDNESRDVRNDASDRFCLDGNKLRLTAGTYGSAGSTYQTELETFSRVTAFGAAGNGPAYFYVEGKDGLIYEYGNTTDSRIESVGQFTVRTWALNKIRDRSGNAIQFAYAEDTTNGAYRIASIQYTSNPAQGVSPTHTVEFVYETKPSSEVDSGYVAGSKVKEITRLDRINVNYNGTTIVRRYELTYEGALSSTSKSRLASIQECSGSPLDCLAATTFAYQNGTVGLASEANTGVSVPASAIAIDVNGDGRDDLVYSSHVTSGSGTWMVMFANASGGYDTPVNTGVTNTNYTGAISIDYNADGKYDLLVPYSGGTWWVMLGSTSGLGTPSNTAAPATATGTGSNAVATDVNGDGLDDLVWMDLYGYAGGDVIRYRLRVWGGTFDAAATNLTTPMPPDDGLFAYALTAGLVANGAGRGRTTDFNGDARGDVAYRYTRRQWNEVTGQYTYAYYIGAACAGAWNFATSTSAASLPVVADFNDDGKTDLLYYTSTAAISVLLSKGTSFATAFSAGSIAGYSAQWAVLDWDSDGYDDFLLPHSATGVWHLFRSTGEAIASPVSTGLTSTGASVSTVSDMNGDGLTDLGYKVSGTWRNRPHAGAYPDLLQTTTDGFGSAVTFNYAPLPTANYTKHTDAAFPEQDYQGPYYVVNSLSASNGIGGTYTNTFQYYGARVHRQGRGFEGFYSKRTQDSRNSLYGYEYFNRLFPYTGTVFQSDLVQPDNTTLISRTQNTWTTHSYNPGTEARSFPFVSSSTTTHREVGGTYNGTLIRTVVTSATVDTWGTPYDVTTTTTENGTGLNTGATHTQRLWHTAVTNDSTNWCLNKPTSSSSINSHSLTGGTQITRVVDHTWDYTNCRMTQEIVEPSSTQWKVTTDLGYDAFGNVNSQTVTPVGQPARVTSTNWGTSGRFPLTITNPLSQATTATWIADLGVLDTVTDPNGLTANLDYDLFARKTRELKPDGTATRWSFGACSSPSYCGDSLLRYYVQTDTRNTSDAIISDHYSYRDLFDREKYDETRTLNGSLSYIHTVYDALGRVSTRSLPYISGSSDPYKVLTYTYDLLDRVKREEREVSEADATLQSTQWTYNGLSAIATDALSHNTTKYFTAAGQIAQVVDAAGSDTDYEYDAFGNLLKTRDFYSNEITLGYNIRGFKTSQSDPDLGAWTYDYFPAGELKSQTDAKSQTVQFTYDKLSRPLTRVESEGTTTWTWGTSAASKNIGQLESVSSPGSYSETYSYDSLGRPSQASIVADGTTYLVNQAYNSSTGFLETLTYPTSTSGVRFKLKYTYQNGHLQKIHDYTGDAQTTKFWEAISTNARGMVIDEELGNGLKTFSKYDHIAGWLDYRQSAPGGGSSTQYLNYAWDKVGNLIQRKDENQTLTENFVYDSLNRLDYTSGVSSLDLTFDAIGNITSKNNVGSYTYHATKKHAVTAAGSNSYAYDANGNMNSRNGASISWTSYNLPSLINQSGGNSSQFWYGANRQRYKQANVSGSTTETTIYVAGLLEKVTVGAVTDYKHYVQGVTGIAAVHIRSSSGSNSTYYPLKDHLGSMDRVTNSAGSVVVALSYDAFGKRRGSAWAGNPASGDWTNIAATTRHGFTEHEHLDNLGLVHMNGRVYDPSIGRFGSADPFVDGAFSTQGFNRMSYVSNNPARFVDPTGYTTKDTNPPLPINGNELPPDVPNMGGYWQMDAFGTSIMNGWGMLMAYAGVATGRAGSNGGGSTSAADQQPGEEEDEDEDDEKCTVADLVHDLSNRAHELLWETPFLNLSISASTIFGTNGAFQNYSASLGTSGAGQIFATFQGPPGGRGTPNLHGTGDFAWDIGVINLGLDLGYTRGPVQSGHETVDMSGFNVAAGPGFGGAISRGSGSASASVPTGGRLGRVSAGGGLAFGSYSGQADAYTAASPPFLGLVAPPGEYSGCGGRVD